MRGKAWEELNYKRLNLLNSLRQSTYRNIYLTDESY